MREYRGEGSMRGVGEKLVGGIAAADPRRLAGLPLAALACGLVTILALSSCGGEEAAPQVSAVEPLAPQTTPSPTPAPSVPAPPPGHPAGSTYSPGLHGYDASYPQCTQGKVPQGATFAIIGVNNGKGFTSNPCLRREWRTAPPLRRELYLNSGLDPRAASKVTGACRDLSRRLGAGAARQNAYAIGCSEAAYSRAAMRSAGIPPTVMTWIDVEEANSWQHDVNLNRFALEGEIDQLAGAGPLPGIYSTPKDWAAIAGNWSPAPVTANWVAAPTPAACGGVGFSGAPIWLVQEAPTWPDPSGLDSDWAC
ncbi:MAG: hypothetical protein J2P28_11985, partial [Actinobacteria bacterium]|nr:hypothetical protein [Actinomycetota bacterium]